MREKKVLTLSILIIIFISITPWFQVTGEIHDTMTNVTGEYQKSLDLDYTVTLTAGGFLRGFIKLHKGIWLTGNAWLDITEPIDGDIQLNGHVLIIRNNLFLGLNPIIYGIGYIAGEPTPSSSFGEAHLILTNSPLIIKKNTVFFTGQIFGNGNQFTVDTASGGHFSAVSIVNSTAFSNIVLTNFSEPAFQFLFGGNFVLDNAKVFVNNNLDISHIRLFIRGATQFIGKTSSSLNLKSTQLYIEPQAELSFNSSYITFQSVSGYIQEWLPSVTFADDTSILTFNNCNVNFSQGDLSYSNTLTFTAGTININGQVNFTTDRTAGYKIMIGDGTVAGDLALQFGPLSRLKIGSNIDFQLRPSK